MDRDRPPVMPLTGPRFYGTPEQTQAIQKWESTGWIFLHWTEVPPMVAVMENASDVIFIDHQGRALTGPGFSKGEHPGSNLHSLLKNSP